MEININNTLLNVTLEDEKYLGEVILGIKKWLKESNMQIKEILQDGNTLPMEQTASWWNSSINDIKKIDIVAITNIEKYIEDLQVVYQYITMLDKAIKSNNFHLANDLLKDQQIIGETLDYFFVKKGKKNTYSNRFYELIELSELKEGENFQENIKLNDFLTQVAFLLQKRINEVTDPIAVLKATSIALSDLIPDITDVSILLQTGKDQQAIDSVITFVELSEKLIRLYSILKETHSLDINKISFEGVTFNDFYEGFNEILKELADAFDSSDTVLIGDLLEYEIVPKIDTLLKFITLIEDNQE